MVKRKLGHHFKLLSEGGNHNKSNLISLCKFRYVKSSYRKRNHWNKNNHS